MTLETGGKVEFTVHHRHPRSRKRTYLGEHINEERNLVILPRFKHVAWHTIINGNELPSEFVKRLNEEFMPPDWYLVAIPRNKRPPRRRRQKRYCTGCECVILQYIKKKEE
jgi:hypothetical protein